MVKNLPTIERSTRLRYGKNCLEDQAENTIVFNASNAHIDASNPGALYLSPIRNRTDYSDKQIVLLMYNKGTKEITESGEAATDIIQTSLQGATNFGNTTSNTVTFLGLDNGRNYGVNGEKGISLITSNCVGIANSSPAAHTLSVGSNLYVDDIGSNVLVVSGNVSVLRDLTVEGNLQVNGGTTVLYTENSAIKDAIIELGKDNGSYDTTLDLGLLMHRPNPDSNVVVGFRESTDELVIAYTESDPTDKTFTPLTNEDIDVHVYGRILTEANVGIINTSPIHTLDVGSNLYVDDLSTNVLVITGSSDITNDLTIGDKLHVENNTHLSQDLIITGNIYANTNVSITEDLNITNNVYANKDIEVIGNVYTDGNVVAYKDILVTGNVYVSTNVNITEDLNITNNVYANKDIEVIGNVYTDGNVVAYKDILVTGNVYVSTNVSITEDLNITNNVYANKDVEVIGNVYVSQNVSVTEELTVSGNVYADKDLEVLGNAYVSGNVVASKDLTLSGNAYVSGNVNVTKQLSVSGNAYVSGNVEVTESLIVSANTHLKGDNVFITHTMDFLDPKTAIVTDQVSNVQIRLGQLENVSNLASNPRTNQVLRYINNEWSNDYPQQNFTRVKNGYSIAENRTLYKGNTVYVSSTQNAGLVNVRAAQSHIASQMPCIGIVYEDIGPEDEGVILTYGILNNLNTSHLTAGGTVYVSNVYSGYYTSVKPDDDVAASPDLIQNLGICTRSHASSGAIFVTGIGRANDIPNAELITDYNEMNYVYVNDTNNDLKKITSANLNIPLTTAVSSSSNSVANAITLRGLTVTTGDGFNGNVNIGGNVSISGLTNKYFTYIGETDDFLRSSRMYQEEEKIVVDTDLEVSGNLYVLGEQVIVEQADLVVSDRIIDIANNNPLHSAEIGILIEHPGHNIGIIHHDDDSLSFGYTQNGYADSKILRDVANVITLDFWGNVITQNSLVVNENINIISGGLGINVGDSAVGDNLGGKKLVVDGDIKIGDTANLYVDVSRSSVGINTDAPDASLHVIGNAYVTANLYVDGPGTSTSTTTGALTVSSGGLGVASNINSNNVFVVSHLAVGTTDTNNGKTFDVRGDANVGILTATSASITDQTHSTSKDTGVLVISNGGVGVESNIHSTNVFAVSHITVGTSETSNALDIRGTANVGQLTVTGMSSEGNIYAHKDLIVKTGNMYVTGNTSITGNLAAHGMILGPGGLKIGNLFSAGPGAVPGVGSVNITGVVQSLAFRTAHDSGYNTGIANTSPDNTFSVGANAYINAYGTTILSITGNTVTTNLLADSHIAVGTSAPTHPLDIRGSANVAALTAHSLDITNATTSTSKTTGALRVTGGVGIGGALYGAAATFDGVTSVTNATASTSKTTGALVVTGGTGIGGALYGAAATFDGVTSVTNATASTSKTTGALVVTGGVGIGGDIHATHANLEDVEADSVNVTDTTASTSKTTGALRVTGGVGIGGALYGAAATFDGVTSVTNATASTSKTTGALRVTGGVGIGGDIHATHANLEDVEADSVNVTDTTASTSKTTGALRVTGGAGIGGALYAAGATFDSLSVAANTDITGIIGRARVGYQGYGDWAGLAHYDMSSVGQYAIIQNATGQTLINSATGQNIQFRENNATKMTLSGGDLGIGVTPTTKLHVAGGTITNSDQVAKKTYSYTGELASAQTIANSTIKITFSNHVFSAKIVAHLIESDNEVSTLSFECGGGNWAGSAPSLNIATGPVTVFGNTSTNPWNSAITVTSTTVSFKPTTNMAVAGHYNVFIEYFSSNSSGAVTKITEGTTDQITFGY